MDGQLKRLRTRRRFWIPPALATALLLLVATAAAPQFYPFPSSKGHILEGNWQSCQEADGRYGERVYDHIVNGVGQFEVHMGPRHEFAIFKGVQDAHRPHDLPDNLLKPYNVGVENNRASHRWEVPTLKLVFTVTLAGGSRTDCESWYISLESAEKGS